MKELTDIERAQRIVNIMRTMPQEWTDSSNWRDSDLDAVGGLLECRFRVNVPSPIDRVYIVHTLRRSLSFEGLEAAGIKEAKFVSLIAIKSMWSPHPGDVLGDEHASNILGLARSTEEWIVKVEAIFRHGKNERDDSPFVFSEWAPGLSSGDKQPSTDPPAVPPKPIEWHQNYFTVSELANMRRAVKLSSSPSTMTREIDKEIIADRIRRDGNKPMRIRMDLFREWNSKRDE